MTKEKTKNHKIVRKPYQAPSMTAFGSIQDMTRAKNCGWGTPDGGYCNHTSGNVKYS